MTLVIDNVSVVGDKFHCAVPTDPGSPLELQFLSPLIVPVKAVLVVGIVPTQGAERGKANALSSTSGS